MSSMLLAALVFFIIFFLMYSSVLIGHKLGKWQINTTSNHRLDLLGIAEGALFALLGLLVAFTFTGAYERFEHRKIQIIEEGNSIHNAYLILDLLKPELKPALHADFKEYIQQRTTIYKDITILNYTLIEKRIDNIRQLQSKIWNDSLDALKKTNSSDAYELLAPALIAMFAAANEQFAISYVHPPITIMFLLLSLSILCGFLTGYNMAKNKSRNLVHILSYVAVITITLYLIFDLELPRLGLIRVTPFDGQILDINKI